jgi:hypothetical protein
LEGKAVRIHEVLSSVLHPATTPERFRATQRLCRQAVGRPGGSDIEDIPIDEAMKIADIAAKANKITRASLKR